jgi:hypothetical protein
MRLHAAIVVIAVTLLFSATAGYAVQEFTLEEAQTRIERLEARVAALEATMATGDSGAPDSSDAQIVTGTLVLESSQDFSVEKSDIGKRGAPCSGDMGSASFRVLDEAGNIVASDTLSLSRGIIVDVGVVLGCQFSWTIEVGDSAFYVFEIANREGPTYSHAELDQAGWHVDLIIGG